METKGYRPSKKARKKRDKNLGDEGKIGVEELALRYAEGRDLWNGEPLSPADRMQWLRIQLGLPEDDDDS